jgi:DNA polymerase-3 subunit beta
MSTNLATVLAVASIETAVLKDALDKLASVVEKRNAIPILDMVNVTSDKGTLFLQGTDLDVVMTLAISANVEAGLAFTAPIHRLKDLVKNAPKGSITNLTPSDGQLIVDFGGPAMKLQNLPVTDFPHDLVKIEKELEFNMPGHTFWDGVDATITAISTEETRYYLNGIFFHTAATGELRMVSTDGHRLQRRDFDINLAIPEAIIPMKVCKILHKLMKGKACPSEVHIEMTHKAARMRFQWGNVTIDAKTIDGTFPDYMRIVPQNNALRFTIDSEKTIGALNQVLAMSSEKGRATKWTFTEDGVLKLLVNNPDSGSAEAEVTVTGVEKPLEIGFNGQYMINLLKTAGKGDVDLFLADAGSPILAKSARANWMSVLMPMRV